jgi:NAD(P)-dependent dehydrogenase (short-subunit alcohol dehydrogenase family)
LRLDLSDPASMHAAADHLKQTFGHLDVLINNASAMPDFQTLSALDADMLNALTTVLARALAGTAILVNAVDPGNTATHPERGDDENDRSAADSARDIVSAATLDADGPTGRLFSNGQPVA